MHIIKWPRLINISSVAQLSTWALIGHFCVWSSDHFLQEDTIWAPFVPYFHSTRLHLFQKNFYYLSCPNLGDNTRSIILPKRSSKDWVTGTEMCYLTILEAGRVKSRWQQEQCSRWGLSGRFLPCLFNSDTCRTLTHCLAYRFVTLMSASIVTWPHGPVYPLSL